MSDPAPNVFKASIEVKKKCTASVFLAQGEYRPDATGMPTERWRELEKIRLEPGLNTVECEIPFDGTDMFAYPTNFKKTIDGVNYNGYHFVHIVDCAELYKFTRRKILKEYAEKWLRYTESWNSLKVLDNKYSLHSHIYGDKLSSLVNRMIDLENTSNVKKSHVNNIEI
jgi:hypothetical protein